MENLDVAKKAGHPWWRVPAESKGTPKNGALPNGGVFDGDVHFMGFRIRKKQSPYLKVYTPKIPNPLKKTPQVITSLIVIPQV